MARQQIEKAITEHIVNRIKELKPVLYVSFLSRNPAITWDVICALPELQWDFEALTYHPNISLDIIQNNNEKKWNYYNLNFNETLTWDFVKSHSVCINETWYLVHDVDGTLVHLSWYMLSSHRNITWDIIVNKLHLPWEWTGISQNPNITWDIVKGNMDKPWNWMYLSMHKNIGPDIILGNPNMPWKWKEVSKNPNIPLAFIMENKLSISWDWMFVSSHSELTLDVILENMDIDWYWYFVSCHPNITWEMIQAHPELPWDMDGICHNKNVKFDVHMRRREAGNFIDWVIFCHNTNITYSDVMDNPFIPWSWLYLSANPAILLSEKEKYTIICKYFAARKIQGAWRRAIADPNYLVCRRRLLRELEGLDLGNT
jgi:hypothetical protein